MSDGSISLRAVQLPRGTLRELNVDYGRGVHVLVGPNGIGKTSLLNAIAGSLPLRSGAIHFEGQPLDHAQARVVLAPNSPPEIPWIRSGLLLEFVLSLYPRTRRDAAYSADVIAQLGIGGFLDAPLGTLSAGTARKVLLAAALVAAPSVMLFDEPTNDIDKASIAAFIGLVREAAAQRVVIITTHHAADLAVLGPTIHEMGS